MPLLTQYRSFFISPFGIIRPAEMELVLGFFIIWLITVSSIAAILAAS
jgi:hypothetical protein